MTASTTSAGATPENPVPDGKSFRRAPDAVAVCVFALLVFSSSTGFVSAAWPILSFQIGVFSLLAIYLLSGLKGRHESVARWAPWLMYITPVWGLFQLLLHTTVSRFETEQACLKWGALCGVFFFGQTIAASRATRQRFLTGLVLFATAMAMLSLGQTAIPLSQHLSSLLAILKDASGTFSDRGSYVGFVELVLPVALWRAVRHGWKAWPYAMAGSILVSSVIVAGSWIGTILCPLEFAAILIIGLVRFRDSHTGAPVWSTAISLVGTLFFATLLSVTARWPSVSGLYPTNAILSLNTELPHAALEMAEHRPIIGFGLGTYPNVYTQFSDTHFRGIVHAQNDWAEFAAEGGAPFLLLVLVPFIAAIPSAAQCPWVWGLMAILLQAFVDHPFSDIAVSGWVFTLLGLVFSPPTSDTTHPIGSPDGGRDYAPQERASADQSAIPAAPDSASVADLG